jgi:hypothetical protein
MTRALGGIATAFALATACAHHAPARDPDSLIGAAQNLVRHVRAPVVDPSRLPPLHSSVIASIPDGSVGPFLARQGGATMAAYLGPGEGSARRLVSLPMGPDGTPKESRVAAKTATDSTTLVLRAAGGEHGAFVAAWTELTERGEALSVVGLGSDGAPLAPPAELTRTSDDIVWIEVVPTPQGAICVWAEETRSNDANILAVPLDPNGKPRGVPSRVAKGVSGWQVAPTTGGAGIALVSRAPPTGPAGLAIATKASFVAALAWLKLDAEARPVGPAIPVATCLSKMTDVDLAAVADSVVFAWTDRSQADPDVWIASIDGQGARKPAHAITARSGGAKLVAMKGGKSVGVVAWEETGRRPRPLRRLHLARVEVDGTVDSKAGPLVEVDGSTVPELAELDDGFALLTRGRTCAEPLGAKEPVGMKDPACEDLLAVPVFVRFDLALHARETEPIRIDEGNELASLAWGLSCEAEQCLVLAAGSESPARVRAVQLTERPNRWRAPIPARRAPEAPSVLAVDTLASRDLYTDISVTPTDDGSLVAAITASVGESAPGGVSKGATIALRPLDAAGIARGPAVTLTKRALSVGGVSLAAGGAKIDGAAVAWVAREGGHIQVHVSRVDRLGRRTKDVQLTTAQGDTSDVAIAWAGGGWIVSWVDTRDGNGEVYATKVDTELSRVAREERVTSAPGDASDVILLGHGASGGDVWLGWSDPRESPRDGFADIFVAKLSALSAKPVVPEWRILATAAHSRSPALAWGSGDGPTIAWIEEAPMGADPESSSAYGAMIGALDAAGHLVGEVTQTRGAGDGFPTSVAIQRGPATLRVVLTRAARDDLFLDALEIAKDAKPVAYPLFTLDGPPSLDVSLAILDSGVFFNDEGVEIADGCARRLSIGWTR